MEKHIEQLNLDKLTYSKESFECLKKAYTDLYNLFCKVIEEANDKIIKLEERVKVLEEELKLEKGKVVFLENELRLEKEKNRRLENELKIEREKVYFLESQLKLERDRKFGKKTEKSQALQKSDSDNGEEYNNDIESNKTDRKKKSCGRRIDKSKIEIKTYNLDLSETDKKCIQCGSKLDPIGEDRSEQLEYITRQFILNEYIQHKYTCRCCNTIITVAKPENPIPKSMAGASLIAEVIISKCDHHLPLYRQSKIFKEEGIDIPENTLGNWLKQAGEILLPLKEALYKQIDNTNLLQIDETPVKLLNRNKQGYMWCYNSFEKDNKFILFEYNNTRKGEVVNNRLSNYKGCIQTDGYGGYNTLRDKPEIISFGCWAHCRRKFAEEYKTSNSKQAKEAINYISQLYNIEREAKEKNLTNDERKEIRQVKAKPILYEFYNWLTEEEKKVLPKSIIGKAITYALHQWKYLERYIDYGEMEIDNNWVENHIRPFAIGRKNWLFIGNEKAAHTISLFYSLIASCKLNGIDPRMYLIRILNLASEMRKKKIDPTKLLPQIIDKKLLEY